MTRCWPCVVEDFLRQTAVPVLAKPFKLADLRNLLAQVLATADTLIAPPALPAIGGLT